MESKTLPYLLLLICQARTGKSICTNQKKDPSLTGKTHLRIPHSF